MLTEQGFIGPVGDDLPSLVPLLIALTVFFSAFALTLQVFGERNTQFDSDLGILQIVRTLRSDSYVIGIQEFNDLCNSITAKQFTFLAGITDHYTGFFPDQLFDPYDPEWMSSSSTGEVYRCTNLGAEDPTLSELNPSDFDLIIRTYPIAVEEERVVYIGHLVVMAWG